MLKSGQGTLRPSQVSNLDPSALGRAQAASAVAPQLRARTSQGPGLNGNPRPYAAGALSVTGAEKGPALSNLNSDAATKQMPAASGEQQAQDSVLPPQDLSDAAGQNMKVPDGGVPDQTVQK